MVKIVDAGHCRQAAADEQAQLAGTTSRRSLGTTVVGKIDDQFVVTAMSSHVLACHLERVISNFGIATTMKAMQMARA